MEFLCEHFQFKVSFSCRLLNLSRSNFYYKPAKGNDYLLAKELKTLADKFPRYGFWKLFRRMRQNGLKDNHKRVYRVYKTLRLNLKRKQKKRLPARVKVPLASPSHVNECWSMDFMNDNLSCGKHFRTLNIIDDFYREVLAIQPAISIPSERVIRILNQVIELNGKPMYIRVDNGPEFISKKLQAWSEYHEIKLRFIEPGKPTQNAYIERFNGSFRNEVLDVYRFKNLKEVEEITEEWIHEYNFHRPHNALKNLSPKEYLSTYG